MSLDKCKECETLSQASTGEEWTCDYCEHQILKRDFNSLDDKNKELEAENKEQVDKIEKLEYDKNYVVDYVRRCLLEDEIYYNGIIDKFIKEAQK